MGGSPSLAVVIQARASSTRLPHKVLRPFGGRHSLLECVIEAVRKGLPDTNVIVATSSEPSDNAIADESRRLKASVFRGSLNNVLDRFVQTARAAEADMVLRVCADNPFIQPALLAELKAQLDEDLDYTSHKLADGTPTILSHLGLSAEIASVASMETVLYARPSARQLEHPTTAFLDAPDKWRMRLVALPEDIQKRSDIRLTVDTQEDFDILSPLYTTAVRNGYLWSPSELIKAIDSDSALVAAMKQQISLNKK